MSAPIEIVARIHRALQQPIYFSELLAELKDIPYRTILSAWSDVRETTVLERDLHGRYWTSDNGRTPPTNDR
jgi:hypothetical protein